MKNKVLIIALVCVIVILTGALLVSYKQKMQETDISLDKTRLIAYIISDSRCPECIQTSTGAKGELEKMFPGITFKEYDYTKSEGKEFYNKYKITTLPAILFTTSVKSQTAFADIEKYVVANTVDAELLSLSLGATFDPTKEICDNKTDDDNNGKTDCDDSYCGASPLCREDIPNRLDLFVMSQCPYGVKALNAMPEVLKNFSGKIDFKINYIATEASAGVFDSLHGQPEVDENIRELCAIKYYPENYKYMDYILCVNKEIEKGGEYNWETCAKNFPKIKACASGDEGKQLLSENIKLGNELQIGASPTWMTNNKYQFSGIDSESVKQNFCQYNTDLTDMCKNVLTADTGTPAAACN